MSASELKLLRLPSVCAKTGIERDTVYRGVKEGWFPKPVKISDRASGWVQSEIDEFIQNRIAERDSFTASR